MWPELELGRHQKSWQLGPCCLFLRQGTGRGVCTLLGLSPSQGWVVQRCLSPLPETKSLLACSSRRNYTLLVLPSSHPQQRASPVALATGHLSLCWFEASPLFSKGTRMMGRGDEGLERSMKSTKLRCSGLILEAWQGTDGGGQAGAARCGPTCRQRASSGGFKPATLSLAALGGCVGGWPCPSCNPKAGRVWRSAAGLLLLCQPRAADVHLLEPSWLLACGCSSQRRRWHF